MYSVSTLPNTILPFCTGWAVQKHGRLIVLSATVSCIFIGQGLFAMGVAARSIGGIMLGRFFFSCGMDVMDILVSDFIATGFS
jgi:MFS family permease